MPSALMLSLADPWVLLALPLPILAMYLLPALTPRGVAIVVPDRIGKSILSQSSTGRLNASTHFLLPWLVWFCLMVAISGPQRLATTDALPTSGRDLVIALDLSGSMVRDDFSLDGQAITRLEAVKKVGSEFVRRRGGDRVGLVVFGSEAYMASPMTHDVEAVARTIEGAVIGISGRATNISDGLGISLKRLEASEARSRVVILLSDGANNAGAATPRDVAKLAQNMGVRVHTIAMGPLTLAEAPDERGVVDAATLKSIADLSGGETFLVRTTEDLVAVAKALDALEATISAGLAAELYRPLWIFPALLAGIGCLLIAWRTRQ